MSNKLPRAASSKSLSESLSQDQEVSQLFNVRAEAKRFALENVAALSVEINDWRKTGMLKSGGLFYELAELTRPISNDHRMQMAESFVNDASRDVAIAYRTLPLTRSAQLAQEIDYAMEHGWPQDSIRRIEALRAADKTPPLQKPGMVLVDRATVYVMNDQIRPNNFWSASVQPGSDDDGQRTSQDVCEAVARRIQAALNSAGPDVEKIVEGIAAQWDTCQYDAPGCGEIDIGEAIRKAGKQLIANA